MQKSKRQKFVFKRNFSTPNFFILDYCYLFKKLSSIKSFDVLNLFIERSSEERQFAYLWLIVLSSNIIVTTIYSVAIPRCRKADGFPRFETFGRVKLVP